MHFFSQWLRRFVECRRGVTAVEFAFVLPILLFFTVGIMEFSTIFMAQNMLENATQNAAREGKTGYVKSGMTRDQYLLLLVQNKINRLMDPSLVRLDTEVFKALSQVAQPEPYTDRNHNGQYDLGESFTDSNANGKWDQDGAYSDSGYGNGGDVTVYTVSYDWHVMTPILSEILGDNGVVTLTSRILVKNEPYGNG